MDKQFRQARARIIERGEDRPSLYVHPGQVCISTDPSALTIILGSCVAVCLWDADLKVGGANHFLLPYWTRDGQAANRFGNMATAHLIEKLISFGSSRQNLQAKLFGGACVIEAFRKSNGGLGTKNIEVARKMLEDENIPVVNEDVGGPRGRKLIFHTDDGSAWVKRL